MYTTIQKWGNSHGIRIPKQLLEALDLRESDKVEIERQQDAIVIRKAGLRHRTLEERLAGFEGPYEFTEWDTGANIKYNCTNECAKVLQFVIWERLRLDMKKN